MAEGEDVIVDAARHATAYAQDLLRRRRRGTAPASVTLLDVAPRVLTASDEAISEAVADAFTAQGVRVRTGIDTVTGITRSGDGTKIVLTGDPGQIDNPYVDSASNGLTVAADRFRGEKLAGHIVLAKGERSELAEVAANLL